MCRDAYETRVRGFGRVDKRYIYTYTALSRFLYIQAQFIGKVLYYPIALGSKQMLTD